MNDIVRLQIRVFQEVVPRRTQPKSCHESIENIHAVQQTEVEAQTLDTHCMPKSKTQARSEETDRPGRSLNIQILRWLTVDKYDCVPRNKQTTLCAIIFPRSVHSMLCLAGRQAGSETNEPPEKPRSLLGATCLAERLLDPYLNHNYNLEIAILSDRRTSLPKRILACHRPSLHAPALTLQVS